MPNSDATGTFHVRAGAPDGGVFNGVIRAANADEAVRQLRQRGFVPMRVDQRPLRQSWLNREIGAGPGGKRLSVADCEAFCREFGLLLGAGVTANEAFELMAEALGKGSRQWRFVSALRRQLRLGGSLGSAIEASGFAVPADLLPVVRAGEEAGLLPAALAMLSESYAESLRFSRAYAAALAYPALLLVAALAVLLLLAFFVAPALSGLFAGSDKPVPLVISLLNGTSAFIGQNVSVVAGSLATAIVGIVAAAGNAGLRDAVRALAFRLPVIGQVLGWSASRRFAGTLRLYLSSNVPIAAALPNAMVAAGFPSAKSRGQRLADRLRAGGRLAATLGEAKLMPPRLIHMIGIGENSGRLSEMLAAVSTEAQRRFEQRMALVSALLAPGLILLVGGLVGSVIFSVFSALLELNEVAF
jgi:type II secretory pathway component PulF